MRTRAVTLVILAASLRKGINVLAIENHRLPCYKGTGYGQPDWPTSDIEDLRLTAPGPAAITPKR